MQVRLLSALRRHVGHQLRCVRETSGNIGGLIVETVAIRCEDCGEVVIEATSRVSKRRPPHSSNPNNPT